jgi:hypothetical protein
MRNLSDNKRQLVAKICGIIGVLCLVAAAVLFVVLMINHDHSTINPAAQASNSINWNATDPPVDDNEQAVAPKPAAQVASDYNCQKFTDTGAATIGGTIDGGTCWIGKEKYGINVFATKQARDAWLTLARNFGVNPKWVTTTAIVYPSVNS